jgi:hypothetical protein
MTYNGDTDRIERVVAEGLKFIDGAANDYAPLLRDTHELPALPRIPVPQQSTTGQQQEIIFRKIITGSTL